jgi:hypothetical protein
MDLKLGDFVRFVDENLEGYVTRIIDKETIGVTDANDFEIPVLATKVTIIHGEIPDNDNIVSNRPKAVAVPEVFVNEGIYLGLVSDQHSVSVAHFHLVNDTSFDLLIGLTTEKAGHFRGEYAGSVLAHSTKKIYSANMSDIQLWPKFKLQILYHTTADVDTPAPILYYESLKGKDLSVSKVDIAQLKAKGWLIRLDPPPAILDVEKLKESFFKGR